MRAGPRQSKIGAGLRRGCCASIGGKAWIALAATSAALWTAQALAAESDIKIALIADKTGPLEAYAKQTSAGFAMGLAYATGGTMMVEGRKLVVIEKDSQTKPDVGRNLLNEAYNDDGADIAVGGTSSAAAGDAAGRAGQRKKIFIVEPAVADSITGSKWNRYIFRTGRNSTQDAASNALAIGKPGTVIATLAQDYAFGRDFVTAFKAALASTGAKLLREGRRPTTTNSMPRSSESSMRRRRTKPRSFELGRRPAVRSRRMDRSHRESAASTGGNILRRWEPAYFPGCKAAHHLPHQSGQPALSRRTKRFNGAPPSAHGRPHRTSGAESTGVRHDGRIRQGHERHGHVDAQGYRAVANKTIQLSSATNP